MKTYFLQVVLFLCLTISFTNFAQITFERSYPSFGDPDIIGLKTIELPNNEYLILGSRYPSTWSNIILTKIDRQGYTIWRKEFKTTPTISKKSNQILLTKQNEIIFINVQSLDNLNVLNIKKLDLNGAELSSLDLISVPQIVGCAIAKTIDDDYLISYYGEEGYGPINILKIDQQLKILWQKKIYANRPTIAGKSDFFIKKWGSNDYAIGFNDRILKINSNGDSLYLTPSARIHNFTSETADGSLLLSGAKTLIKIDSSNNIIWTRNFLRNPGPAIQTSDGNYLVFVQSLDSDIDSLIKFNEIGDLIWRRAVQGTVYNFNENADKTLLSAGILYTYFYNYLNQYGPNYWILKTDSFGNYNAINLITPIGAEKILTFSDYTIGWHSSGVEKINLYYTIDDGKNWNSIVNNFNANTSEFIWYVPLLFTDSIIIKIEDADNHNNFNYTEYPVYISIYQPTDYISTNEIFMWIGNNGMSSHDPRTDGSGFYWPGGDSATISAIFADGLVWGGKVNGEIRVNGNTYRDGLQPGRILENGKADNPFATQSKIFKIRKDWQSLPESVFKDRLEYDYNHWPVEAGAPWDDVNQDGVYTPGFDTPKFIGDETLFYPANDLDTTTSRYTYGSDPIGLEFQTTVFGFNREDLKDVVFKKYTIINKSNSDIMEMYFAYFADNDMGDASDDFVGCDSSLSLGYTWNSDNDDGYGYGLNPPAIGHMVIQGPMIKSGELDSAYYNFRWNKGYKNLKMNSFGPNFKNSIISHDPPLGIYEGALQWYNLMHGKKNDGSYWFNPHTSYPDTFALSGDPVTGFGWFEGLGWPGGPTHGGDRRYSVNSGPFNLAVSDTQEVVYAIMMAKGTDNINSITKLRELAAHVQEFYNTELVDIMNTKQTIAPTGFTLFQNYPNPFNPKTTIEYEVPEKSLVTIKIYDILGREVQTLVNNEEKVRWKYKVLLDASTFASGVYFYRMQTGGFVQTKKMIVLK